MLIAVSRDIAREADSDQEDEEAEQVGATAVCLRTFFNLWIDCIVFTFVIWISKRLARLSHTFPISSHIRNEDIYYKFD